MDEALPGKPMEQIVDPRQGMTELSALLSTPMGARTFKCNANLTLRDVVACLRGEVLTAVFTCAFFLAAARGLMLSVMIPHGAHIGWLWAALEPALWACVVTSLILVFLYTLDSRKSLTIDSFGLIVNTQMHEGVEMRLLVPWTWLVKIGVRKSRFGIGGTEFHMETKYGMVYTLRWDDVATSTVTETLIAAVRTLAPQAEIDLGQVQAERTSAQESFTELWLRGLSSSAQRVRIGSLGSDTILNGRYKVAGFLGAGGQGTAYLAVDETTGQDVVLKEYVLPAHSGSDALSISQVKINREIELLKSLDHPNVVRLVDHFTEDYRGYLVLEFISGSQLKEYVDRIGPYDEQTVADIGIQVCRILQYLHELKPPVVHQDITPDNLIRQEDGTVKLVDFNVARKFASDGSIVVVGKHAYIPPEQFRGKTAPQSDIYALGCTMYFLLTGKNPEPMTVSRPARAHENISRSMDRIVQKATALGLTERYANAGELADALRAIAASDSSSESISA